MIEVHRLTSTCKPAIRERVWFWRADSNRWVVETMTRSIDGWIGNTELAYTHWAKLEEPPAPRGNYEDRHPK